ncbi:hypothetical protein LDENG_00177450 [Lucifuga dentata]|nr:hypothetical protein LDENG_00177450 [Lucifuga dentata]
MPVEVYRFTALRDSERGKRSTNRSGQRGKRRQFTFMLRGIPAGREMTLITFITLMFLLDLSVCVSELGPPGWREPLDCVRASELCNQNSQCSSRYRIMRQCLSGGDKERSAMLASKECQGALEVLQDSPLYDCRCKRSMKKELQCLQNYWSIHMGLTEGKQPCSLLHCHECFEAVGVCALADPFQMCCF